MPMKSVQVRFPEEVLARIDAAVERGEAPSRAEFIRDAVRTVETLRALARMQRLAEDADLSLEALLEGGDAAREALFREMFEGT